MIQSMTGFGKAVVKDLDTTTTVQARSLNNRYAEIRVFGLKDQLDVEHEIVKKVKQRFLRGKIDINIHHQPKTTEGSLKDIKSHYQSLKDLQKSLQIEGPIDLSLVLHTLAKKPPLVSKAEQKNIMGAVEQALILLEKSRQDEGRALVQDVVKRIGWIDQQIKKIQNQVKGYPKEKLLQLKKNIAQLVDESKLDQNRLEFEVAILVERSDITEEFVRLTAHLEKMKQLTNQKSQAVGREIDFLLQEINREINTIGSKTHQKEVSQLVVKIKSELEKVREQVQNLQ